MHAVEILIARTRAAFYWSALALVAALCFLPSAARADDRGSGWPRAGFTEVPATENPKFPDVEVTYVSLHAPLPSSFGAHPAACDKLGFLRFRHIGGPNNPSDADTVMTAQPGVLEGAAAFMNIASNMVTRAWNEQGKNLEFWAIDRRANCLEDTTGLDWGMRTGDAHNMLNYYYRGASVDGKKFAGFPRGSDARVRWLSKLGMDQTLKDWNAVITRGLPSQADRQAKLYCGGHSLGGFITAAYAQYDFDGDPATLDDAGYNQCRGYFGLDTIVTSDPLSLRAVAGASGIAGLGSLANGFSNALLANGTLSPYFNLNGAITPEIMYLISGVGAAARIAPTTQTDLVKLLPADSSVKLAYGIYFSRNLLSFATGTPGLADFRMTNQALLGTFLDDNSMPLSIVQASIGFYDGGPVASKEFPLASNITSLPGLSGLKGILGTGSLAIPTDYGRKCALLFCWYQPGTGPLYKWRNYNQLAGMTIPRGPSGAPFTNPSLEVTDINDLSLALSSTPSNFVEAYFPTKLLLDTALMFSGSKSELPGAIHPEGVAAHPTINVITGDGPLKSIADAIAPGSPTVPGYQHLDVLMAAPVQNDGQPEKVSTDLLGFLR